MKAAAILLLVANVGCAVWLLSSGPAGGDAPPTGDGDLELIRE